MEGAIEQVGGKPILTFRHYDPYGELLNNCVVEKE